MSVYVRAAITTIMVIMAILLGLTVAHYGFKWFPEMAMGAFVLAGVGLIYFVSVEEERRKDRYNETMKEIRDREAKYRQQA